MGLIAQVLAFVRGTSGGEHLSEVKTDPGGGANVSADHFADAGDDSFPLPSDFTALTDSPGTGRKQAFGYADPLSAKKANLGDKRIYARKSDGTPIAEVWLKNDGTIVLEVLDVESPIELITPGVVVIDSPDIRIGRNAGRRLALVGDTVNGTVHALCTAPGTPLAPNPAPVPGTGVPFSGKITGAGSIAGKG